MASFLDRLLGRAAPAPTPAVANPEDGALKDLRARVRMDVAAGYDDEDVILTHIGDYFEEEIDPDVVRREAPRILREEVAAHARATAQWPAVTDCDRLEAAFAALEEDGVVARQNFTCCMTCGSTEIWDEIREAEEEGQTVRGYTFFHAQDTEAAVEGHGVYLAYGACDEGEAPALKVARRIVSHLEAQGLRPEWNGSWDQRIALPLDWKRRR
jgi:hypothetical protein